MKPPEDKHSTYPFDLRVSTIKGAGVGLFARVAFRRGDSLHHLVGDDARFVKNPKDMAMALKFGHKVADGWWLPTHYGRMSLWWYANHSAKPNVDCHEDCYVVLRDIAAGDEITIDYSRLESDVDNVEFRPDMKKGD